MTQDNASRSQAIQWYVRLHSGEASAAEQAQWQQWHDACPSHQAAWSRLQQVQAAVQRVPATISQPALAKLAVDRRAMLKGMALWAGGAVVGVSGYQVLSDSAWLAEYRTATGERRSIVLADGTKVTLNTDSALDVQFDDAQRVLHLRAGEMLVETAKDPYARPFIVTTTHGRIRALGTQFLVRQYADQTLVAVLAHAVEIQVPAVNQPVRLAAGQQLLFSRTHIGDPVPQQAHNAAWQHERLMVVDWRLADLLAELSRYRHGWLRCDPAVAALRVSGVYPLDDTDTALLAISQSFPVRMAWMTRYWVTVLPV